MFEPVIQVKQYSELVLFQSDFSNVFQQCLYRCLRIKSGQNLKFWNVSPVLSFARSTLENLCAKTAGSWNHNVFPSVTSQWAVTHHIFSRSKVSFWVNYCESSLLPSGMKNKDLTKTNWSSGLVPFVVGDPYNGIPSHSMKWKWQLTAKVHFSRWLSPLWIATRGCRCQCRLDSFQSDRETHLPEMIS